MAPTKTRGPSVPSFPKRDHCTLALTARAFYSTSPGPSERARKKCDVRRRLAAVEALLAGQVGALVLGERKATDRRLRGEGARDDHAAAPRRRASPSLLSRARALGVVARTLHASLIAASFAASSCDLSLIHI